MKTKILMVSTGALVVGALMFEGHQNLGPAYEKMQNSLSPNRTNEVMLPKADMDGLKEMESEKDILSVKEELESRIREIDLQMKNSNMIERLNDRNLDQATREEFFEVIELKQSLIKKLVDMEIQASRELLAGGRK